jgi:hypothetical protein
LFGGALELPGLDLEQVKVVILNAVCKRQVRRVEEKRFTLRGLLDEGDDGYVAVAAVGADDAKAPRGCDWGYSQ